jgi:YVTN family beta-propeller protein
MKIYALAAAIAATATAAIGQDHQAQPYTIAKTIALGPAERWDYATFDGDSGRVYVAHGDHVTVVDPSSGNRIGDIGLLPGGTHGIGISTENGIGYTDDGKAGVAASFDLKTLKLGKQIKTAPDADGIVSDPASKHIFVINGDSGAITVIDPKANAAIATITVGAPLEAGAADGMGKLFVDGAEQHDIIAIDTHTNKVLAHFPMAGCERPHGIAVDAQSRRVFSTCANKVMVVVDAETGKNVATLPIGAYNDGAAFDPVRKFALSSNGDGTLTVVQEKSPDSFAVLANVPTVPSARTIAIDPKTGRVFLPAANIAKMEPAATPGGRPRVTFVPGSMKLLVLEPTSPKP